MSKVLRNRKDSLKIEAETTEPELYGQIARETPVSRKSPEGIISRSTSTFTYFLSSSENFRVSFEPDPFDYSL